MDPLTRKLFQPREAREKLRGMGGIMSSSPQLASTVAKFQQGGPIQAMAPERVDLGGAMPLASAIHGPSGMMYGQMSLQQLSELANSGDRLAAEVLMMLQPPTGGTLPDSLRARLELISRMTDPDSSFGRQLDQFSARLADFGTQPRVAADLAGMDAPSIDAVPTIALDTAPAAPRQAPRAVPQGAADTVPSVTPSFLSLTPSLGMPSAPDAPLPSAGRARATRVGDRTFVLTDDGRVLDAQTGAPATPEVEAEVRSRLSPQLSMMDIVGEPLDPNLLNLGVNPSFREDTSGQLPPMPSDIPSETVPANPGVDPEVTDAFGQDMIGAGRTILSPIVTAIDQSPYGGDDPFTFGFETTALNKLLDEYSLSNVGPNINTLMAPVVSLLADPAVADTRPVVDTAPVADTTPPAPTLDVDLDDPDTYDTNFEEMMRRLGEATGKEDKSSRQKAMADLAMIGLAIAAGQSPDALTNIAQGALTGVKAIRAEDAATSAADRETRSLAARMATEQSYRDKQIASNERIAGINLAGRGSTYGELLLQQIEAITRAEITTDPVQIQEQAKANLAAAGINPPAAPAAPAAQITEADRQRIIRERVKAAQNDPVALKALEDSLERQGRSISDYKD
jgi:hypothetical protein